MSELHASRRQRVADERQRRVRTSRASPHGWLRVEQALTYARRRQRSEPLKTSQRAQ
jgi:hypothetical protein